MIRAGESSIANLAAERFDTRVLPVVTGELVRAGKPPLAAVPVTFVRLFAGVRPQVGLEVGGLAVELVAALVGALVEFFPFLGAATGGLGRLVGVKISFAHDGRSHGLGHDLEVMGDLYDVD